MENETKAITPEAQQPQRVETVQLDSIGNNLEIAIKSVIDQIHFCDEQIAKWQEQKHKLQTSVEEKIGNVQKKFNITVVEKKRPKFNKTASVPELIRLYLEKNGPTRSRDIRKFLISKGKKTNPGVALGRMVNGGLLKNIERGIYQIA
jgi:hypothetical protein